MEQQLQAIQTELNAVLAQSIETHIVAPVQALLPILCTRLEQGILLNYEPNERPQAPPVA